MITDRYVLWMASRNAGDSLRVEMALVALALVVWYLSLNLLPAQWRGVVKNVFIAFAGAAYGVAFAFFVYTVVSALV
jgi:hypothetical protein